MHILVQFLFRMSFGLALGMAITSPRQVTSGYYRNHLYVLLGLNVLATLVALGASAEFRIWLPAVLAGASYVGAVQWLYEKHRAGIVTLWFVSGLSLVAAWQAMPMPTASASPLAYGLAVADVPLSGLVLGVTMAAMLLGHWYLNSPTMALAPLKRLLVVMGLALAARGAVAAMCVALEWTLVGRPETIQLMLLAVRWLFGLLLAGASTWMAWQTLKIPNTQSATGLLYVAVIATFLGELVSLMISSQTVYPV